MFTKIMIALVLLAPAAAAGGFHIDAPLFDEAGECTARSYGDSYGNWTPDNYWYSYYGSESRACDSSYTTAGFAISDDQGELASARLGGDESTASDDYGGGYFYGNRYPGGSSYGGWSTSTTRDDATRQNGLEVRALGQNAHLGTICNGHNDGRYDSYYHGATWNEGNSSEPTPSPTPVPSQSSSSWSQRYAYDSDYASTCETGAHTETGGRSAFAGWASHCEASNSYSYQEYSSGNSGSATSMSDSRNDCRNGPEARAAGTGANAGSRSRCEDRSDSYQQWYNGNGSEWSSTSSRCSYGHGADGPDNMTLFVGSDWRTTRACDSEGCSSWESNDMVAYFMWAHAPFGLGNVGTIMPQPTLP